MYLSLDLETTGLPGKGQIIEIGLVADDLKSPLIELPTLSLLVLSQGGIYSGQAYALAANVEILKSIDRIETALRNSQAVESSAFTYEDSLTGRVLSWLRQRTAWDGKEVAFAGKNFGTFDSYFLEELDFFRSVPRFRQTPDPGSMYWQPGDGTKLPDTKTCLMRAGIYTDVKHRALDDAYDVCRLIRFKMNHALFLEDQKDA